MRVQLYSNPKEDIDLDLFECGYEDCSRNFEYGPYVRQNYLIHFVVKGSGFLLKEGKEFAVETNNIFAIFPEEITKYYTDSSNPWSFYWISFNGKKAEEYMETLNVDPENPIAQIDGGKELVESFDSLLESVEDKERISSAKILGYLYIILYHLGYSKNRSSYASGAKLTSGSVIDKAIMYIEHNYFNNISIKEISDFVGLERSYFSKHFKNSVGVSPQDYLINYRMQKAADLIKTTDYKMKFISKCVGISDEYYFSKLFKKNIGVSPRRFRLINFNPTESSRNLSSKA